MRYKKFYFKKFKMRWKCMRSFEEVIKFAKERGPKTISVACCQDKEF
ncbi:phosphate butyryltransferase domain protein [Clostridioides difficile DA00212]|nr:phosphate butyryltransferase domain protein [Clostridioides difficile DA00212]